MAQKPSVLMFSCPKPRPTKAAPDAAADAEAAIDAAAGAASSELSPLDAAADLELAESTAETAAELASETETQTVGQNETAKLAPVRESRVKKTLLNARVNLIFYFLTLVLSFFSRKIFLDCLGAEFIGLTGTLQNLLGFLNLAELGIGSAIGYLLYKPIFDQDHTKINEIISVMGYLYRWIGLIILGGGVIMSCFLPLIFPSTGFSLPLIYFAFYSFLASSLIGYFINYRQNLLGADQKNYVVTAYFQTMMIVKTLLQMGLAWYTRNYYLWVAIELSFGIIYSFILNWKINQTYPWLKSEVRQGRKLFKKYPEVMKKSLQLFIQKIAVILTTQSNSILIYSFVSLPMVALFGNYTIIIDKIYSLLFNAIGGIGASVGNLVAEGNRNKILNVYKQLLTLHIFFAGILFWGIYFFSDCFIKIWLGNQYIIGNNILIPIFLFYGLELITAPNNAFLYAYGLFKDIWAPLTEGVLFIILAIILGKIYGLWGILMGRLISLIVIRFLWKPYYLFSMGLKCQLWAFWKPILTLVPVQSLSAIILYFVLMKKLSDLSSWQSLVLYGSSYLILLIIITFLLFITINKHFKEVSLQLKNYFLKNIEINLKSKKDLFKPKKL